MTALLALLGYAGNVLALPLLNGVDLIFGSIATMLAARVLGVLPTLIVSLAASSHTLVVWHHPYAVIIFAAEALLVSLLYRRYHLDTLLGDALFWLLLGLSREPPHFVEGLLDLSGACVIDASPPECFRYL